MKKLLSVIFTFIFIVGVVVAPSLWAAGGKVQGDEAVSDSFGGASGKGASPGADAQDNQV